MAKRLTLYSMDEVSGSRTADFSSNDYLSLTKEAPLKSLFLEKLALEPNVLGATGSRLLDGNTPAHLALELRLRAFYRAPAALIFNTGFDANLAIYGSLPQSGDVVVFDELVHASIRDGIASAYTRPKAYPFEHNSTKALEATLRQVLKDHPHIKEGKGTVFVALESLYSMDGDFAPLQEIVRVVNEIVPQAARHIVIDEAHTTGIIGEGGRGFVCALGLEKQIHTRLHTFSKALAFGGAVVLTSELNQHYMTNFARPLLFATALPISSIVGIDVVHSWIECDRGREISTQLAQRTHDNAAYFLNRLVLALHGIPSSVLCAMLHEHVVRVPGGALLISPVFPIKTPHALGLAEHLKARGYYARAMIAPVVARGEERVRVCVRAGVTKGEMDEFVDELARFARAQMRRGEGEGTEHGEVKRVRAQL
ncbi:PLP-dependent transferase [Auriscalpium vulgare]|uniref:PLP-dependent transferase n=1 Tax=Auriscalpium vulgare TaxID=40419 RepID=A0ACB8RXP4_9AGAM|nr:PLP-dependent transferase [Auriscalpium vulgare]